MCHIPWVLPILGLPLFWLLDVAVALPISLGLLAVSALTILLTMQSLRQAPSSGIEAMHGELAEVVEPIHQRGRVRYHHALWYARARDPIEAGATVRIVGNQGLCLLVEPWSPVASPRSETDRQRADRCTFAHRR